MKKPELCPECFGSGEWIHYHGKTRLQDPCPVCKGINVRDPKKARRAAHEEIGRLVDKFELAWYFEPALGDWPYDDDEDSS